jgi:DNA-binding protein H-NS
MSASGGIKMPKLNLKQLPIEKLVRLRDEVEAALSNRIAIERKDLQTKISALEAFQAPRRVQAVTSPKAGTMAKRSHPAKGKKAAPKYRGPNGELWAGRGLAPKWLVELEKKGKKRETFLIAP